MSSSVTKEIHFLPKSVLLKPFFSIIFKTAGYHNCLLNNSIKRWSCNLWLGGKPSSTFHASRRKKKRFSDEFGKKKVIFFHLCTQ